MLSGSRVGPGREQLCSLSCIQLAKGPSACMHKQGTPGNQHKANLQPALRWQQTLLQNQSAQTESRSKGTCLVIIVPALLFLLCRLLLWLAARGPSLRLRSSNAMGSEQDPLPYEARMQPSAFQKKVLLSCMHSKCVACYLLTFLHTWQGMHYPDTYHSSCR